jgi:hypothetical protein
VLRNTIRRVLTGDVGHESVWSASDLVLGHELLVNAFHGFQIRVLTTDVKC